MGGLNEPNQIFAKFCFCLVICMQCCSIKNISVLLMVISRNKRTGKRIHIWFKFKQKMGWKLIDKIAGE